MIQQEQGVSAGWRVVDAAIRVSRTRVAVGLGRFGRYLMALPAVALVSVLAWGLGDLIWKSIHAYDSYLDIQGGVALTQFREVFTGPNSAFYRGVLLRTVELSVAVTVSAVLFAVPVAYFIVRTRSRVARLAALTLALVPFLMGEVVRVFGWLLILGRNGLLAWFATLLGHRNFTLIGTTLGIWIGALQTMLPIAVFVLLPAVRRVEPDLERAAQTLGAPPRRVWREITFPLIRPGLVAAAVVVFALMMTEYAIPDIVGGGVLPFAANAIQGAFFMQGNIYLGAALSVLLLVVVITPVVFMLLGLRSGGSGRTSPAPEGVAR